LLGVAAFFGVNPQRSRAAGPLYVPLEIDVVTAIEFVELCQILPFLRIFVGVY
jgi:hypothetical protein